MAGGKATRADNGDAVSVPESSWPALPKGHERGALAVRGRGRALPIASPEDPAISAPARTRLLDSPTYDGFPNPPALYTRWTAGHEAPVPAMAISSWAVIAAAN